MKAFILGYNKAGDKELTLFENKEAAFDAEEWVVVYANTIEEAKLNYESAYDQWLRTRES